MARWLADDVFMEELVQEVDVAVPAVPFATWL
jgi:hypothetical protein